MSRIPTEISKMRIATENDFRTKDSLFKLNVEYKEWMYGSFKWEFRITEEQTDREWLKEKIKNNFILIHETPIIWNQLILKIQ